MRNLLPVIIVAGLAIGVALPGCGCKREQPQPGVALAPPPPRYNVVFVSFDALQAAHVGCLGYSRNVTPTLDRVARESVLFTRAYSVASWTVPSSMSWFTGVYPSEHRMVNKFSVYTPDEQKLANLKELAPELVTLADIFRQNGYATGAFTGNAGVSGGFGYDQGFDVYYFEQGKFGGLDESIPRALAWLKANRHRPFFLFLHGYDAHGQNTPADGLDYRFVDKNYDGKYRGTEQEQEILREEGLEKRQLTMRDADVRFWRAVYDEKINRADEQFARFLAEFDQLGVNDRTIFVLTSDHGTEFYEHRRFDHGFTLYNELLHVPLVVKVPGRFAGKVVADRVGSIDVMPTILELAGLSVPEKARRQLRGASLVPALRGERVTRDVFSETDYRQYTYKRSVITPDGWKLVYTLEDKSRELYDLDADPGEQKDLAASESRRADELQGKVFAHFKSIGHDLTARKWETGLNPVYPSQAKEPKK
jgi:arylsulfatase A-like enzyme